MTRPRNAAGPTERGRLTAIALAALATPCLLCTTACENTGQAGGPSPGDDSRGGGGSGRAESAIDPVPDCVPTCTTAADCAEPDSSPLSDASHYTCRNNRCEYQGCRNTLECTSAYGRGWVCEASPGTSIKDCVPTCNGAADCVEPNAPPLSDASHYACRNNRCDYLGCRSTAECAGAYGTRWICE